MALVHHDREARRALLRRISQALVTGDRNAPWSTFCDIPMAKQFNVWQTSNVRITVNGRSFHINTCVISARAPKLWQAMQSHWVAPKCHPFFGPFEIKTDEGRVLQVGINKWMRIMLYCYSGHHLLPRDLKLGSMVQDYEERWALMRWNTPVDDMMLFALANYFGMDDLEDATYSMVVFWMERPENHHKACVNFLEILTGLTYFMSSAETTQVHEFMIAFFYRHERYIRRKLGTGTGSEEDYYNALEKAGVTDEYTARAREMRYRVVPCECKGCGPQLQFDEDAGNEGANNERANNEGVDLQGEGFIKFEPASPVLYQPEPNDPTDCMMIDMDGENPVTVPLPLPPPAQTLGPSLPRLTPEFHGIQSIGPSQPPSIADTTSTRDAPSPPQMLRDNDTPHYFRPLELPARLKDCDDKALYNKGCLGLFNHLSERGKKSAIASVEPGHPLHELLVWADAQNRRFHDASETIVLD